MAWFKILQEYTEAIGNSEYSVYKNLFLTVGQLTNKYQQIISLCGVDGILRVAYSKYLCEELNRLLGTNFKFNFRDESQYLKELDRCLNRASAIKIQLDLKLLQLYALKEKESKNGVVKQDRAYYISVMIQLSNHAKYNISDTITVMEYATRLKQYKEYVESLKTVNK